MRTVDLLFLWALCVPAFAAPPCLPGGPCLPGYSHVPNSWHYEEVIETDWKSRHGYWKVEDSAGQRKWYKLSCAEGNDCFTVKWAVYQISMYLAPEADKRRIQEAAYTEQVTYTCDTEAFKRTDWVGRVCREQNNILAAKYGAWDALLPAQTKWVVAYNSACSDANKLAGTCTRPVSVYNPATKTRSVAKGETVAVGAPCYPAVVTHKDSATSSITYMAIYPDRTDRVAVCTKG